MAGHNDGKNVMDLVMELEEKVRYYKWVNKDWEFVKGLVWGVMGGIVGTLVIEWVGRR